MAIHALSGYHTPNRDPQLSPMAPYERFEAWQYAHRLTLEIYRVTRSWPIEERYALSTQVRR